MFGINKVYLVGHLGNNPKSFLSKKGKPYARLSLATHRSRKTEDGGWEPLTEWHDITVWGKQGESCLNHLKKGAKVMIEGYLSHYETKNSEGKVQKQTGITAQSIEFFNSQSAKTAA